VTTPTTVQARFQLRADTAANWTSVNPVLLINEFGLETDTKKLKVGNGSTAWSSLAYFPSIVSGGTVLGNLEIGTTGTLTFEGSTADGFETTLAVVDPTADRTITLPNQSGNVIVSGNASIVNADISATAEIAVSKLADGAARQLLQTDAAGTEVEWASNIDIPGTLDVTGAATFDAAVTIAGDLTVNGTTTNINTQNLVVEDKNVILGDVATPTDVTADGGGITLKGATDKTINWVDATDAWTLSEHVNIASGKEYRIAGTKVLDATSLGSGVTGSSLTSVGTIGTGVWQGTAINKTYLDSTLVSTGDTGTVTSTMILDGTILNADVNASAAIAGTKVSPDFGSQNVITTGTVTGASLSPTSSTAPTNGVYLAAANTVAVATNSTGKLFINSSGQVGIGSSTVAGRLQVGTTLHTDNNALVFNRGIKPSITASQTAILCEHNGIGSAECLTFMSDAGYKFLDDTGVNELMRLTSTGLAIGTTSPTDTNGFGNCIDIRSSTGAAIYLRDNDDTTNDTFVIGRDNSDSYLISNSGNLLFSNNGSERARIDSSGRLLVGTSSPAGDFVNTGNNYIGAFQVARNVYDGVAQFHQWSSNASLNSEGGNQIFISRCKSGTLGTHTGGALASGDGIGRIIFNASDGTNFRNAAFITAEIDGGVSTGDVPGRLVFSTTADGASSPTERWRYTNNGETQIRNMAEVFPVTDNACLLGKSGFRWSAVFAANGTIQTSDERAKADIADAALGSDFVKSLRPVSYKWIEGGKRDTGERDKDNNYIYESVPGERTHWGFIAQEVKEAVDAAGVDFGGWVLTDKDDPDSQQALRYDQFIAPLTKALQEALEKIETLEAKVAALEAQ